MPKDFTYNYSFEARLHQADDNSKQAFNDARTLFEGYGLKLRPSWKKVRVSKGREVFALIVFRGKKLAICFALNPSELENSKYKGKDLSEKKLYVKTPFEFKITSARKVGYLEDLIDMMLMGKFEYNEKHVYKDSFRFYSVETLVEKGLVKKIYKKKTDAFNEPVIEYVPFKDEEIDSINENSNEDLDIVNDNKEECHKGFVSISKNEISKKIKVSLKKSRRTLAIINIKDLNKYYNQNDLVDLESLKLKGLVAQNKNHLKVLGDYGLRKSLRVKADYYSYYAKLIIEELNGEIL